MKPHESNEQLTIDWANEASAQTPATPVAPAQTPAPPVAAVASGQPPAGRSPMLLVAIIGAVVGGLATIAFVGVGADAPVEKVAASAAISPPPAPPAVVESIAVPTWTGARRFSWANDGSKTIAFHLAATRDLTVWMNKARPVLAARCLYRTTEAFVILDTSASFEHDADRRTVRVQWDDEPATVQQWGVSETGRELFAPDAQAFIERMARAQRLQFGFTPFNAEPVTAEFVVAGFDQIAGLVTGTCK